MQLDGPPGRLKGWIEQMGWKFSAIDGDPNLGAGVKAYATRQFNKRFSQESMVVLLNAAADALEGRQVKIIRRKVELVIYDDRSSKVGACDDCATCHTEGAV